MTEGFSYLEDSQDTFYENVDIDLPDLDDTQIIDEHQREVSLFTNVTASGKVTGAESTPFLLPKRWTFSTLELCVTDYVNRQSNGKKTLAVKQLYFKRSNGSKVVKLNSDADISVLLKEYPTTYPSGKKKKSRMYLAADIVEKSNHGTPPSSPRGTPRRSPRLAKDSFTVYLFKFIDGKVGNTARVITNFSKSGGLNELIDIVRALSSSEEKNMPENGIYWLRKGSKQPLSMKTNMDFTVGKDEYNGSTSIRIACTVPDPDKLSTGSSRKRKLDLSPSSDNGVCNEVHLSLVRDLEKKGVLWRYGVKHLKLWMDKIVNGDLAGAGQEPEWEQHLDQIITPPKSRRNLVSSNNLAVNNSDNSGQSRFMEMLLIQNQTLMTMMASNMAAMQKSPSSLAAPVTVCEQQVSSFPERKQFEGKDIKSLNLSECCDLFFSLGLGHLQSIFEANNMDGPLLLALTNPQLGSVMLDSMGLSTTDKHLLVTGIKGYM